jgi:hypothetical protein
LTKERRAIMAKHNDYPKANTPTQRDVKLTRQPDWKRDRYEQRNLKVTARRTITGGF